MTKGQGWSQELAWCIGVQWGENYDCTKKSYKEKEKAPFSIHLDTTRVGFLKTTFPFLNSWFNLFFFSLEYLRDKITSMHLMFKDVQN